MSAISSAFRSIVSHRPTLSLCAFIALALPITLLLPDFEGLNALSGLAALAMISIPVFFLAPDPAAFDWPRAAVHLSIGAVFGVVAPLMGLGYACGAFWQSARQLHDALYRA